MPRKTRRTKAGFRKRYQSPNWSSLRQEVMKGGVPEGGPAAGGEAAVGFEALGEVDILDGDEAWIEAMDFLKIPAVAQEEAEGEGEVGEDGEDAGEDPEGPALGEDKAAAADEFAGGEVAKEFVEIVVAGVRDGEAGFRQVDQGAELVGLILMDGGLVKMPSGNAELYRALRIAAVLGGPNWRVSPAVS